MENKKKYDFIGYWTNACRFLLAAVFIFSGFVKANDLAGTEYKVQDYITAFGLNSILPSSVPFFIAFAQAIVEFCIGVYLFWGIRRKISTFLVLLMMSFMTPLTLWLAVSGKVIDCGCFGDALVLTNWETFIKNIFLLVAAISVFRWKDKIRPLVTSRFDWLIGLYSSIYILIFTFYSYRGLPLFDFRPYYIGANIKKQMEMPKGEKAPVLDTRFILEKNGVKKEFSLDNYPDSTWTFIDSKTIVKEKGYVPLISDFMIEDSETGEDITSKILDDKNYSFILVSPSLKKADDSAIDLINELYDYCIDYGYNFYCVTSASNEDIDEWKRRTGAEYPFAFADELMLKTMIRSNPGLVLIKDATVVNKWSVNDLPDEYVLSDSLDNLPIGKVNQKTFIHKIFLALGWFIVPLLSFSVVDAAWEKYKRNIK